MTDNSVLNKYGFFCNSLSQLTSQQLHQENARIEKWAKMLRSWQRYSTSKHKKLKSRIRKGIPSCFRGYAWYLISDSESFKSRYPADHYQSLLQNECSRVVVNAIAMDLSRTYPSHIKFKGEEGRESLNRLLKAYSVFDQEVGYTQGMSYIAALFLIFLSEESSFWLFATVMKEYHMREFFIRNMPGIHESFYVMNGLVRHNLPAIWKHFKNISVSPSMYATQWFMTGFNVNFSIEISLRVWDSFLLEGQKIFFRAGLAMLKIHSKEICECQFEEMMLINKTLGEKTEANELMRTSFSFYLTRKLIYRLKADYSHNPKRKYLNWERIDC